MAPYATPTTVPDSNPALQAAGKLKFWKCMRRVAQIIVLPPAVLGACVILTFVREAFVVIYSGGVSDHSSMGMIVYATILPIVTSLILALPGLILLIVCNIRLRFWHKQEIALTS